MRHAVDGAELYKRKKTYGAEYRARLAAKLRAKGYEITITDSEQGFFELQGMEGKKDLEIFSTRRAEIVAEMNAQGVSGAAAAQRATLATRESKRHDIDEAALHKEWSEVWGDRPLAQRSVEPLPEIDRHAAEQEVFKEAVRALEEKNYAWTDKKFEEELTQRGIGCGMTRERAKALIASDHTLIRCTLKNPRDGELDAGTERGNLDFDGDERGQSEDQRRDPRRADQARRDRARKRIFRNYNEREERRTRKKVLF